MSYTVKKDSYVISTGKNKIDIEYIHSFLTQSYWSPGISVQLVKKAMENSLCFGIYESDEKTPEALKQIGYARMITDEATFAYLADVFIDENYRSKGLAKWLVDTILVHPSLQGLRKILLVTRDAQKLYGQCGFTIVHNPGGYMVYNPQKG